MLKIFQFFSIFDFDNILFPPDEELDQFEDIPDYHVDPNDIPKLAIKSPLTRKRKVSISDLIASLKKALNISKRKEKKIIDERNFEAPKIPEKKIDITALIKDLYDRILEFFNKKDKIKFDELVNSDRKEDILLTLIPLLHLDNKEKITLEQKEHFGDIHIIGFK